MSHADDLQALNRSEHLYWACEGYLGSIHQPYVLRFQGPLEAATVRQALRELTSACPRLRGVVEPTPYQGSALTRLSYRPKSWARGKGYLT